jgi:hypothetical protein
MRSLDPPKARKPLAGTRAPAATADSHGSRVEDLERTVERVRLLFEAYFLGMERRAPEQERTDLQRRLNEARRIPTANTALKFRFDTLVQRFTVLSAYWSRTMREIETGTYRRDVLKAERHIAARAARREPAPAPARAAAPAADERTLVDGPADCDERTWTGD